MVTVLPKFSQYQLSELIKNKLGDLTLEEVAQQYQINMSVLEEIFSNKVVFKIKHYDVAALIMEMTIEELLADEEVRSINFRSKHEKQDNEEHLRISTITNFFKEVCYFKKMSGEI